MPLRGLSRRTMGEEDEYGFLVKVKDQPNAELTTRYLLALKPVNWLYAMSRFWAPQNGSCYYQDINDHPEFTTPESLNGKQVAGYSRWGEQFLASRLATVKPQPDVVPFLVKNNVSAESGRSYGCHENYLTLRELEFQSLADSLMAFMVTRILWAGAGNVVATPHGWSFELSQRARYLQATVSEGTLTTALRAIINSRDEPLCDRALYRRLHLICGDANVLWLPSWLKYDMTALVLLMIENGELKDGPQLASPVNALHQLSRNWKAGLLLADGRIINAIGIQRYYLECGLRFTAKHGLGQYKEALAALSVILDNFAAGQLEENVGKVDWVTKGFLRLKQNKSGKRPSLKQAQAKDLDYHVICGGEGSMQAVRDAYDPPEVSDWVAKCAVAAPNDRAALRAKFARAVIESRRRGRKREISLYWQTVKAQNLTTKTWWTVELSDPFQSNNSELNALIRKL